MTFTNDNILMVRSRAELFQLYLYVDQFVRLMMFDNNVT